MNDWGVYSTVDISDYADNSKVGAAAASSVACSNEFTFPKSEVFQTYLSAPSAPSPYPTSIEWWNWLLFSENYAYNPKDNPWDNSSGNSSEKTAN